MKVDKEAIKAIDEMDILFYGRKKSRKRARGKFV